MIEIEGEDILHLIHGRRYSVRKDNQEVGHAYLYVMGNDLHRERFGFVEDVWIDPNSRGSGFGGQLVQRLIDESKKYGCYKLILNVEEDNSKAIELYESRGFQKHNDGYRMNL